MKSEEIKVQLDGKLENDSTEPHSGPEQFSTYMFLHYFSVWFAAWQREHGEVVSALAQYFALSISRKKGVGRAVDRTGHEPELRCVCHSDDGGIMVTWFEQGQRKKISELMGEEHGGGTWWSTDRRSVVQWRRGGEIERAD